MLKTRRNQEFLVSRKFVKFSRKSQAALEFLTTYAWAFLVILIMVGALAYFGILSPSQLLPDRCNFGSEIACDKDKMVVKNEHDNTLIMRLANNFGTAVTVIKGNVTSDVENMDCRAQINDADVHLNEDTDDYSWPADTTITFGVDCTGGANLVEKEKIKFNIEINYYPSSVGLAYNKTIFGEIFTTVQ